MSKIRRIGLTLAAAVALTVTPTLTAQAAQAAPSAYQCDSSRDLDGVLVVFRDGDYGGECRAWSSPEVADLSVLEINDDISSLKNRTPNTLCFYSEANYHGTVYKVYPWEWHWDVPSEIDNQISSFDVC